MKENKMQFYAIMPFIPSDVPFMAKEYVRFSKSTGMKLLLPSMTLHPEGNDPYKKADLFIKAFAELKKELEPTGIKLGILLQSLVGHGYATSAGQKKFQVTIGHNMQTRGRICMLDENFLKYCSYTVSGLARQKPEVFLLDDDTRTIDNDRLECFCPLHLAKFSRRYQPEELARIVLSSSAGDPVFDEFERIRRSALENFCKRIRRAIDEVNPDIPCGISSPGREMLMFERMAKAAAGKNTPFLRWSNGLYCEQIPRDLPRCFYRVAVQKRCCGDVKMYLDESDTYPHNLYSMSTSGLLSHITTAILFGARGSKIWIANYKNPKAGTPNAAHEKCIRDHIGFFDELVKTVAEVQWQGVSVPLPDTTVDFHPPKNPPYRNCQEWFSDFLGRVGIPATFRNPDDPEAECFILTGELVRLFHDADLQAITRKNMILDGSAAEYLQEKGFGELLGVRVEKKCPHFSFERDHASGKVLGYPGICRKLVPVPGAKIISSLYKSSFAGSTDKRVVAPGTVRFHNKLNRDVVVWAGTLETNFTPCDERQQWFINLSKGLGAAPVYANTHQDVFVCCGRLKDGSTLVSLVNLNFDSLEKPCIVCENPPRQVLKLSPAGTWEQIPFTTEKNTFVPDVKIAVREAVILKLK